MIENISIVANTSYTHDFPFVGAAAGDELVMNFYQNNVLLSAIRIMTPGLGGNVGEITIGTDKYTINIPASKTALLPSTNVTYQLFKVDGYIQAGEVIYNGTVTVTGTPPETIAELNYINNNNIPSIYTDDAVLLTTDCIVYHAMSQYEETYSLTLPDARAVKGKIYKVKNIGEGSVQLIDSMGGVVALIKANEFVEVISKGDTYNDWQLF